MGDKRMRKVVDMKISNFRDRISYTVLFNALPSSSGFL